MLGTKQSRPAESVSVSAHGGSFQDLKDLTHPGGNPGANLKSISHRCYLREVVFEWELTKETIYLTLGCLQGGKASRGGLPGQ